MKPTLSLKKKFDVVLYSYPTLGGTAIGHAILLQDEPDSWNCGQLCYCDWSGKVMRLDISANKVIGRMELVLV